MINTMDVPIIKAGENPFPEIPPSVRLAILLPTARWNPLAKSIIGALAGVADEEIAVLIADNSENDDKHEFLKKMRAINPHILAVKHEKNVGALGNFFYLHDWCRNVEYSAIMADDDWLSPDYHPDAYRALLENPKASSASAGTTFVDMGDCRHVNVNQPSMRGATPLERVRQWNSVAARATMYNVSRRSTLEAAIDYIKTSPVQGLTLFENVWELSRLALGDFLCVPGHGCLVHYPANGSHTGDGTQRFYDILCKVSGLRFPMLYFMGLSTAVQCALLLMGDKSPIEDPGQRALCGQQVFRHVFLETFLPKMSGESSHAAAEMLFAGHPAALAGFRRFCGPEFTANPVFGAEVLEWFIELIRIFETPDFEGKPLLSQRFREFAETRVRF